MKKFIYIVLGIIVLGVIIMITIVKIEDYRLFKDSLQINYDMCKSLDNPENLCAPLLNLSERQYKELIKEELL